MFQSEQDEDAYQLEQNEDASYFDWDQAFGDDPQPQNDQPQNNQPQNNQQFPLPNNHGIDAPLNNSGSGNLNGDEHVQRDPINEAEHSAPQGAPSMPRKAHIASLHIEHRDPPSVLNPYVVWTSERIPANEFIMACIGELVPPDKPPSKSAIRRSDDFYIEPYLRPQETVGYEFVSQCSKEGKIEYGNYGATDCLANCEFRERVNRTEEGAIMTINIDLYSTMDILPNFELLRLVNPDQRAHKTETLTFKRPYTKLRDCDGKVDDSDIVPEPRRRSNARNRQDAIKNLILRIEHWRSRGHMNARTNELLKADLDTICAIEPTFQQFLMFDFTHTADQIERAQEDYNNLSDAEKKQKLKKNRNIISATLSQMRKKLILCSYEHPDGRIYTIGKKPYEHSVDTYRFQESIRARRRRASSQGRQAEQKDNSNYENGDDENGDANGNVSGASRPLTRDQNNINNNNSNENNSNKNNSNKNKNVTSLVIPAEVHPDSINNKVQTKSLVPRNKYKLREKAARRRKRPVTARTPGNLPDVLLCFTGRERV